MDRLKYHVPNRNNVLLHRYPNYFERIVLVLLEDVVLDLIDLEQMRDRTPRERERQRPKGREEIITLNRLICHKQNQNACMLNGKKREGD